MVVVSKSIKFGINTGPFDMKSIYVSVSSEDLGLPPATSEKELRDQVSDISYQVEALLAIEEVKESRVHANQLQERLRPWAVMRRNSKSPTTALD